MDRKSKDNFKRNVTRKIAGRWKGGERKIDNNRNKKNRYKNKEELPENQIIVFPVMTIRKKQRN